MSATEFEDLLDDPPLGLTGDPLTLWLDKQNKKAIVGLLVGQRDIGRKLEIGLSIAKWVGGSALTLFAIQVILSNVFHI